MTAVSLALPPFIKAAACSHGASSLNRKAIPGGRCWGAGNCWRWVQLTRRHCSVALESYFRPTNKAQTSGSLKARAAWRGSSGQFSAADHPAGDFSLRLVHWLRSDLLLTSCFVTKKLSVD